MKNVNFFIIPILALIVSASFLFAQERPNEKEEAIKDLITTLNEIKKEPHFYDLQSIDNRMKALNITYTEINLSENEFIKLEAEGCKNSINWLMDEIRKNEITLNYIIELENLLIDCNLDYEKAGIEKREIEMSERWSYIALAKDTFDRYKETGKKIYLDKHHRFIQWGGIEFIDFDAIK